MNLRHILWSVLFALVATVSQVGPAVAQQDDGIYFQHKTESDLIAVFVNELPSPEAAREGARVISDGSFLEAWWGHGTEISSVEEMDAETLRTIRADIGYVILISNPSGCSAYIFAADTVGFTVLYCGYSLTDRQMERFLRACIRNGEDVAPPRGFESVEN